MMALPYLAAFNLTRELLPGMLKRRSGQIVNITSVASRLSWPAPWPTRRRGRHEGFTSALRAMSGAQGSPSCWQPSGPSRRPIGRTTRQPGARPQKRRRDEGAHPGAGRQCYRSWHRAWAKSDSATGDLQASLPPQCTISRNGVEFVAGAEPNNRTLARRDDKEELLESFPSFARSPASWHSGSWGPLPISVSGPFPQSPCRGRRRRRRANTGDFAPKHALVRSAHDRYRERVGPEHIAIGPDASSTLRCIAAT